MESKMPALEQIISGEEITAHYLDEEITKRYHDNTNETFRVFRYNQKVYAVRYDETGPIDSISMWRSHKGENVSEPTIIGKGEDEYLSGKVKNRKHSREVQPYHFFTSQKHQEAYEGLKGDALKRAIINELKDSLSDITTKEELKKRKTEFFNSPQMQIIDRPQGTPTKTLNLKTDAHKAVVKIFKEAEKQIDRTGLKM